tara:strand:+ start:320 stop:556 length:237 start_codon:yes stop_codon:yes gene_type:complete
MRFVVRYVKKTPMNHTDTQLEIIQYLYNELDEKQNFKISCLINSNNELKKDYDAYKEVKSMLNEFVLKSPPFLLKKNT